jgi:hypothetical protein
MYIILREHERYNMQGCELDSTGSKYCPVAYFCEKDNGLAAYIKARKFLDELREYEIIKRVK